METHGRSRLTCAILDDHRLTDRPRAGSLRRRGRQPFHRSSPLAGAAPPLRRQALSAFTLARRPLTLLIISLLPTCAATGSSGDPAGTEALSRYSDDTRLDRRISLTARAEPLGDVLARLSRETGIGFAFLGRDVGDQRVTAMLKDQSLRRVQALLAETLGLSWMRERNVSGYRYILFEDVRGRKEEEALRDHAREQFEEGLHRVIDSLSWSPEEVSKRLPKDSSWASWLSQPGRRIAFSLLGKLSPASRQALMRTGRLSIPFGQLSPEIQRLVLKYVEEANRYREARDLERGTPRQHRIGDVTEPGGKVEFKVFGGVPAGPDSSLDFGIDPADGHPGGSGLGLGYTPEELRRLREEDTLLSFRRVKGAEPEPGPRVTVTWKQKPDRWEEVLKAVVEGAKLQVVSDSYLYHWWEWNMDLPDAAALRDRPLSEVLDRIAEPFLYVWRRDGDVYLFRQRNWYLEKQHNVPERDLRRWRRHLRDNSRLELSDLAELALLTDRQLRNVDGAGIPVDAVRAHQPLLRLFAALNPFQKARLEAGGVRLGDLLPAQAELLLAWKPLPATGADTRLRLHREAAAEVFRLETGSSAPQEERVPLERARPASGG